MDKGANFSECEKYRYSLWRIWDDSKNNALFIGLNPSTADAEIDDPTIRRCINYAKGWGYGGLYMANLFAYRATDPKVMKKALDPVGPYNNSYLIELADQCGIVVCAWGNHGRFKNQDRRVKHLIPKMLHCLEKSKHGNPKHPLYLKKNLVPILF